MGKKGPLILRTHEPVAVSGELLTPPPTPSAATLTTERASTVPTHALNKTACVTHSFSLFI